MTSETIIYPYTDEYDIVWVDSCTFIDDQEHPCFFCRKPTKLVDINFESYYCGEDDEEIRRYLERLDATEEAITE